jgi:hypothetical protein
MDAAIGTDAVAVMGSIGQDRLSIDIMLGYQIGEGGAVASLTRCQLKSNRKTLSVGLRVGFWSRPRRGSGQEPGVEALLAPAAQWFAWTMVLSTSMAPPPPSAKPDGITSHSSPANQCRNRRCTEGRLPNFSGRSRQGAPVQAIQKIESSTRRWSCGGRPPRAPFARKTARRTGTLRQLNGFGSTLISRLKISFGPRRPAAGGIALAKLLYAPSNAANELSTNLTGDTV